METVQKSKSTNIFGSFRILKGNTLTSVVFEPLWGIPYVIFNFYLSLYMKELGISEKEFGYLISIGFITGAVFSVFGGAITDRLGRKRTTLIFDLISWPGAVIIYLIADNFWMFLLATVVNSAVRIVATSWNLMVVEDADNEQRIAAFNLLNIINIATGVIIPAAGILVSSIGIVKAERWFLAYAAVSMTLMIVLRNHFYKETAIGQRILDEHKQSQIRNALKDALPLNALAALKRNPASLMAVIVFVIFNVYITIGTFNSLYFAPYMTDVLQISKSTVSILGGVYSAVMFVVFIFIIPPVSKFNKTATMIVGLAIQVISLFFTIIIPPNSLTATVVCIAAFALGFGIFRPFIDTLLAEVSEGKDRAGIYAIVNMLTCAATALIGVVSGNIYSFDPRMLYVLSIVLLLVCIGILAFFFSGRKSLTGE